MGEDGEVAHLDVALQSTGVVASILQGTSLDEDLLFLKFEGQRMHTMCVHCKRAKKECGCRFGDIFSLP